MFFYCINIVLTALSFKIVLHGWKCCYFIADIKSVFASGLIITPYQA